MEPGRDGEPGLQRQFALAARHGAGGSRAISQAAHTDHGTNYNLPTHSTAPWIFVTRRLGERAPLRGR